MKRVVVTGMGVVTPIGNDVKSMWNSMLQGKHGIGVITNFDPEGFKCKLAAEVKDYDPLLYMDKKEMNRFDPFTVFALGAASQAMDDSGIAGNVKEDRIGVYFSSGVGGLVTFEKGEKALIEKGPTRVSPFSIPAMIPNSAAAQIAIKYNCHGSCISIATACASSTHAIGEAYRTIKHGYADAILAGGSDAAINPIGVASFCSCMALTKSEDPDRASIPFDSERSGFVIGEGAGAVVLEEYEHAVSRGAHIYAEICGYGSTCDAFHITSPCPDGEGAANAIRQALNETDMNTDKIYINAHGTSTTLNDKIETLAIKKALGEDRAYKVYVSSTKSMTGHLLGGAGAVEAVASIQALTTGIIPPTVGYKTPDVECDLNICPNQIKEEKLDLVLSNSLGFGGHNGCIAFRKI